MRGAMVPISSVRENGFDVRIARFAPSENVSYAMFTGGGLAWAETAMKQGRFAVPAAASGIRPDLTGLSCRFEEMPSVHGLILALLVVPGDARAARTTFAMWSTISCFSWRKRATLRFPQALRNSAGRRRASSLKRMCRAGRASSIAIRRAGVLFRTLLYFLILRFRLRVGEISCRRVYLKQVVENSDFRKYDDALRMIIDCTPELADEIERRLAVAARRRESCGSGCTAAGRDDDVLHAVTDAGRPHAFRGWSLGRLCAGRAGPEVR